MKHFKTKAGTELPILDLRGKDYLQVAHRLVWFREEHPDWSIITEYVQLSENHAVAKATIIHDGVIIATAHKCEDRKGFGDFIEKAETGAIGRALAACGYGTQFAPELDEEERIVDSPMNRIPQRQPTQEQRGIAQKEYPTNTPRKEYTGNTASYDARHNAKMEQPISEKQIGLLMAVAKENNWSTDDIKAYLGSMGLKSRKELNKLQLDKFLDNMRKFPKQEAAVNG